MINNVILMGRLVSAPETKTTQTGLSVCRFRIAVDRDYSADGEKKADFISCTAWRQTADFIGKYFTKGSMIAVQGAIQTDSYTDKDGNKRNTTDVLVTRASFCGEKKNDNAAVDVDGDIPDDDELPFWS